MSTNIYIWKQYILAQTYTYGNIIYEHKHIYIWKHYILAQTYTYGNILYQHKHIYMETVYISTNIYIWKQYISAQTYTYGNLIYQHKHILSKKYILSGQALKAIFQMKTYLHKITSPSVQHILDLFEKLITPILNYGRQV